VRASEAFLLAGLDFAVENLAERVRFNYRRFRYISLMPTDSELSLCLYGLQAHSALWVLLGCCMSCYPKFRRNRYHWYQFYPLSNPSSLILSASI
jgi:hypothetical protein